MTYFLLAIIGGLIFYGYLMQIVKQLDVTVIAGGAHQEPEYHVHKRRWEVWWDEWGWVVFLTVGLVVGYWIGGL